MIRPERHLTLSDKREDNFEEELSKLYFILFDDLVNYGLKFTDSLTVVEDSIQEIFVDLLQNPKKFAKIKNPKYYILKSIKYIVLKEGTQNTNTSSLTQSFKSPIVHPFENEIIEEEESDYRKKVIKKVLNELSPNEKESIYLKYVSGLEYYEIAGLMNIKVETARTLVYRAIKKIRKHHQIKDFLKKINLIFLL